MGPNKFVRCCGGVALGLGMGSAMAAAPWLASADATDALAPGTGWAADVLSALPAAGTGSIPDLAISFDGMSLLQDGTATATTVAGNYGLAVAYGDGSRALDNGSYDSVFSNGADSTSYVGGGMGNVSIANGADSITNVNGNSNFVDATGYMSNASAVFGNSNTVIADGAGSPDSGAQVLGGSNDLVTTYGANDLADTGSSNDVLTIVGNNDSQAYTQGLNDIAAIFGNGDSATAGGGDYNLAAVFGDGSTAFAGLGNNDLAIAFSDLLNASAIGGNMTDIEPSMTAATAMADLFGGSAPDASWLTTLLDGSWLTGLF